MREIRTSGSRRGGGETVIGHSASQSVRLRLLYFGVALRCVFGVKMVKSMGYEGKGNILAGNGEYQQRATRKTWLEKKGGKGGIARVLAGLGVESGKSRAGLVEGRGPGRRFSGRAVS
jgi:hypothetical protein